MLGLALEGGGARGAYHMGVVKAYLENGFEFDGFAGTSIGAFNAAVLAQGDFEKLLELWSNISMEMLFDEHTKELLDLGGIRLNTNFLSTLNKSLSKIISEKGVDTAKMKALLESVINEEKLRSSKKDYGLVTISLSERKPYEIFLEDIPVGMLVNYLMASSCFPGFKPEIINDIKFMDGGLYNNCPINMLLKKGYDNIIAVRTNAPGRFAPIPKNNANIKIISPSKDLGNIMLFSKEQSQSSMTIGYYDGLRSIHNLRGQTYYIEPSQNIDFGTLLMSFNENALVEIGNKLGFSSMPAKRILFEKILPHLGNHFKLSKNYDYEDLIISLLEECAKKQGIEQYKVYNLKDFISAIKEGFILSENKTSSLKLPLLKNKNSIASEMLTDILLQMDFI